MRNKIKVDIFQLSGLFVSRFWPRFNKGTAIWWRRSQINWILTGLFLYIIIFNKVCLFSLFLRVYLSDNIISAFIIELFSEEIGSIDFFLEISWGSSRYECSGRLFLFYRSQFICMIVLFLFNTLLVNLLLVI